MAPPGPRHHARNDCGCERPWVWRREAPCSIRTAEQGSAGAPTLSRCRSVHVCLFTTARSYTIGDASGSFLLDLEHREVVFIARTVRSQVPSAVRRSVVVTRP